MADRELLELAAKAAGYEITGIAYKHIAQGVGQDDLLMTNDRGGDSVWNPLTDDGAALRLAVRLDICWRRYGNILEVCAPDCGYHRLFDEFVGDNREASVRRAIVRAAAEIGKAMP